MNSRTTVILGVVLLLLVGYLVLSNRAGEGEDAAATLPPIPTPLPRTRVIPETGDSVTPVRLEVSGPDEQGNLVRRVFTADVEGTWSQIVPTATQLITGSIVSQANSMLNISARQIIPAGENPLSAYGLDDPTYIIAIEVARNDQTILYSFNVGAEIVGGTGFYLQREGDGRIYVVDRTAVQNTISLLSSIPVIPPPVEFSDFSNLIEPITSTVTFTETGNITLTLPLTDTGTLTSTTPVTTTP